MRYIILLFICLFVVSCQPPQIDMEKPVIDMTHEQAFPKNCAVAYFGEAFVFDAIFSDNNALGSYNIEIHHNFDHHSHSTDITDCTLLPKKSPQNPFVLIQSFGIPSDVKTYQTSNSISLPIGDENGLYDEGDYHFFISLTDKEGWSTQKGVSIKLLHKD